MIGESERKENGQYGGERRTGEKKRVSEIDRSGRRGRQEEIKNSKELKKKKNRQGLF